MPIIIILIKTLITYGYQYQYVRNTLQLNQGPSVLENDSIGAPVFSDIGFMSGMCRNRLELDTTGNGF